MNGLSEFEKQRQANIAERDALLAQLKLDSGAARFLPSPKVITNKNSQSKKRPPPKRVKEEASPVPLRQSSRLRGITADSEVAKRKAEHDFEVAKEAERANKVRKTGAFTQNEMFIAGQKLSGDSLIGVDVVTKGVAEPYVRTFDEDDIKKTTDKDLKSLREEMSALKLWEAWDPQSKCPRRVIDKTAWLLNTTIPVRDGQLTVERTQALKLPQSEYMP